MSNCILDRRGRELAETLGGHWSRGKGMGCCPAHDDRTPSLGLRLGARAILLHCFAGCPTADVLAALARRGITTRSLFDGRAEKIRPALAPERPDANAVRLWRAAAPFKGTLAAAYLESRAIYAASREIRFLARTPFGPRGRTQWLPALIAAVRTDVGVIAIQRTFLTPDGGIANMARPKRGLGSYGVGAVRLCPPDPMAPRKLWVCDLYAPSCVVGRWAVDTPKPLSIHFAIEFVECCYWFGFALLTSDHYVRDQIDLSDVPPHLMASSRAARTAGSGTSIRNSRSRISRTAEASANRLCSVRPSA